jgi:hypothetical protein
MLNDIEIEFSHAFVALTQQTGLLLRKNPATQTAIDFQIEPK